MSMYRQRLESDYPMLINKAVPLLLLVGICAGAVALQPMSLWGKDEEPKMKDGEKQDKDKKAKKEKIEPKITIHDDEQLRGKSVIIRQSVPDMELVKFNNRSESLVWQLPKGKAFVLFDDKNFRRPVLVLVGKGEVLDLGKQQPNALHSITSISLVPCSKGKYPQGISTDVAKVGEEED